MLHLLMMTPISVEMGLRTPPSSKKYDSIVYVNLIEENG
jgi:hypothetical protein